MKALWLFLLLLSLKSHAQNRAAWDDEFARPFANGANARNYGVKCVAPWCYQFAPLSR
jgi:hypothetical protein